MKNTKHPAFIIGVVAIILFIIGAIIKSQGYRIGDYIAIFSVILGGILWIWSIVDVATRKDLKPFQKRFWLIAVVAAPAIGGMVFYILHQRAGKLTT